MRVHLIGIVEIASRSFLLTFNFPNVCIGYVIGLEHYPLQWSNGCGCGQDPQEGEAYLFREVNVLQDIKCHLATAHLALAGEPWAVLSDVPPFLQTFEVYGQRFGVIEPNFKDYKSVPHRIENGYKLVKKSGKT
ncbi:hypothetical protein [Nostoc sp. CALU 1950]|uniref:hypothetical protein n=1 Tax=Nostoc sp. CALU 1950 TaxID=3104321 RepID=UPI003EC08BEE